MFLGLGFHWMSCVICNTCQENRTHEFGCSSFHQMSRYVTRETWHLMETTASGFVCLIFLTCVTRETWHVKRDIRWKPGLKDGFQGAEMIRNFCFGSVFDFGSVLSWHQKAMPSSVMHISGVPKKTSPTLTANISAGDWLTFLKIFTNTFQNFRITLFYSDIKLIEQKVHKYYA